MTRGPIARHEVEHEHRRTHYLRIELGEAGPTAHVLGLRDGLDVERGRELAKAPLTLTDPFPVTVDLIALASATGRSET